MTTLQPGVDQTAVASLFEEVVSGWNEPLWCQSAQSVRPCRNQARWLAVLHAPCGRKLLCTFHYRRWLGRVLERIRLEGAFGCPDYSCSQEFTAIGQCARFVRL